LSKIIKKKNKGSFIIIYCHSGLELFKYPLINDELFYKNLINAGADLVIGSHPHRTQGFEKYNNKFIFYSIGDLFVQNTLKKDWLNYITKPAHASFYKNELNNEILFRSYIVEIGIHPSFINLYEVSRDISFNYEFKKICNKKFIEMSKNYKNELNSNKVKSYRQLIEKKVFNN
jgi:poly-gamma-glutamate capsule biosynthesis protein CapA/YwtB (metallophosphatase superfamily)